MSEQPAKPTIDDIMGPAIDAIGADETVLPEVSGSQGIQGAPIVGGPVPGFGVVSDPDTGLMVLLPSYQLFRGTAEYEDEFTDFRAALRDATEDRRSLAEVGELMLEYSTHEFLHLAYAANSAGGDAGLDEFIQQHLLPQTATFWALLDAYSHLARHKLPAPGDAPLEIVADLFGDIDPYGNDGRDLAVLLWFLIESDMHPSSVHPSTSGYGVAELQDARQRKPISKKAKKHALRTKKR